MVTAGESVVWLMLQYSNTAAKEQKIVNGTAMCVRESFSRTGLLKSCRVPLFLGFESSVLESPEIDGVKSLLIKITEKIKYTCI